MSSAFYPQGMNSWNNRAPTGGYKTWKGTGPLSNPVGITSGNIRPFTNNDAFNTAVYKTGSSRPLKIYRRGISVPVPVPILVQDPENPGSLIESYYYSDRQVKSSVQDYMVAQMQDQPGRFIVKENKLDEVDGVSALQDDCKTCKGVGIVSSWYPITNLTEKPEQNVTNPVFCCNEERKARRRALPASTILKKNYYTTNSQYLFNRCQTFDQRAFNFYQPQISQNGDPNAKGGSPLATDNLYVANCNPNGEVNASVDVALVNQLLTILLNQSIITQEEYMELKMPSYKNVAELVSILRTYPQAQRDAALVLVDAVVANVYSFGGPSNPRGCKLVSYKPNNYQFAQQGAVSSSTRNLKLNVDTITTNAASLKKGTTTTYGAIWNPFVYKTKVPTCNPGLFIKNGNPKTCFRNSNDTVVYL